LSNGAPEIIDYPKVTIQLPVYNELYVIERLIDAVCEFDYPKDALEFQVLDDSTDETVNIIAAKVKEKTLEGIDIQHVRRPERIGYKAGALKYGNEIAKGEFIAIFDADFIPPPDFLKKTIPFFKDEKIGVVQTRWGHINKDYSLLTKLQAFGLDAHFTIEQSGRSFGKHFINFNGTAGVWRLDCINDAGGWQADTLTEDLDLSYRAQEKGWKFKYLEEFESPAELPAAMSALKSQQYRWTKGAAECSVKNLKLIFKSDNVNLGSKFHGFFHLMNSFLFICIIVTALLSVPVLLIKSSYPEYAWVFNAASILLLSSLFLAVYYFVSRLTINKSTGKSIADFLLHFPLFLCVSMGLSLHNSIAVIEAYMGKKTPFVRTPKFNVNRKGDKWNNNVYVKKQLNPLAILEIAMAMYALVGIALAFWINDFGLLIYHIMLVVGFSFVSYHSIRDYRKLA
jgi:cellulose synthase/poly-beta-1,6-N-acetylglucosamine synthase-like glycosyltransferase